MTVLGWNVNNKEECPSVQRVLGGGEGVWVHKATVRNFEQSPLTEPKSEVERGKGGEEPRLERTFGTNQTSRLQHPLWDFKPAPSLTGNTLWAA